MSAKDNLKQKLTINGKPVKTKTKVAVTDLKSNKDFENLTVRMATDLGYITK